MSHVYICSDNSTAAAVWPRVDNLKMTIAAGAPTVSDDDTAGYEQFSEWIDTTGAPDLWVCVDPSTGAAMWEKIYPSGGGGDPDLPLITGAFGAGGPF